MRTPYTYRIRWSKTDINYYGVRYAHGCHPSELFVSYFTSSKYVAEYIKEHGMPDVVEIRKIFDEHQIEESREYEHRVLRRLIGKPKWLNKTHNKSRPPLYGSDNPSSKLENRAKISAGTILHTPRGDNHPRRKNPEKWSHLSNLFSGRENWWCRGDLNVMKDPVIIQKHYESLPRGKDHPNTGKTHQEVFGEKSEEYKLATSLRFKGKPKEKVTCPHCGKTGGKNVMVRWHFDNCKMK